MQQPAVIVRSHFVRSVWMTGLRTKVLVPNAMKKISSLKSCRYLTADSLIRWLLSAWYAKDNIATSCQVNIKTGAIDPLNVYFHVH